MAGPSAYTSLIMADPDQEGSEFIGHLQRFQSEYSQCSESEKITYVNGLLDRALDDVQDVYSGLEKANAFLGAAIRFVEETGRRAALEIDLHKLQIAKDIHTSSTSHRVDVKKAIIQRWIGKDEFDACFRDFAGLKASEELQRCLRRTQEGQLTSRRLLYAWVNLAMGRRLANRRAGIRKTPQVTRSDLTSALEMLDAYLKEAPCVSDGGRRISEANQLSAAIQQVAGYRTNFARSNMRLNLFGLYQQGVSCTAEEAVLAEKEALACLATAPEPAGETDDLLPGSGTIDPKTLLLPAVVSSAQTSESITAAAKDTAGEMEVDLPRERSAAGSDTSDELSDAMSVDDVLESGPASSPTDSQGMGSSPSPCGESGTAEEADGHSSDGNGDAETDCQMDDESESEYVLSEAGSSYSGEEQNSRQDVPPRILELLEKIESEEGGGRAGKGLVVGDTDERAICLTPDCEELLRLYVREMPVLEEDGPARPLLKKHHRTQRNIAKMVALATCLVASDLDLRLRDLFASRSDIRGWRDRHDDWITTHRHFGDNLDYLPIYTYSARAPKALVIDKERLRQQMFGRCAGAVRDDLEKLGNGVFADGFAWIRPPHSNLVELMREEMDVMRYHVRQASRSGRGLMGWNNGGQYMLCAQLCRLDLGLYAQAVACRDDENPYQLMTIPSQAKHAEVGDNTEFRHCDFNPNRIWRDDLVRAGRTGHHRLQVSVSLDEEDPKNCTVVVDSLHCGDFRDLQTLMGCMKKIPNDYATVNLTDSRLSESKVHAAIGRSYRPIPVNEGGVRFMNACTFHGSTGEPTMTRRVLYPWYTRVDSTPDEHGKVTLSLESEVLSDPRSYVCAVTCMETPPTSGSGQPNKETNPPFRFPALSALWPTGALAGAVSSHRLWDEPAVQEAARKFFENPYVAIREQRRQLVKGMEEAMRLFRNTEMELFGDKSYYRVERPHATPPKVSYEWSDEMDRRYAKHECVREYLAGRGPAKTCLGDACIS